jgi:DNA ligase-1
VASYDSQEDKFKTIAKVGTGLTDLQWRELKERCDDYAVQTQPSNLICPAHVVPAVWVSPALVCEIQADEITVSPGHSAGYALRFPRFISLRSDKSSDDATTVEELKRLYQLGL